MSESTLEITDELLVAYVDGELSSAQRTMVKIALTGNPALRRRAAEMRLSHALLCEAFPLRPDAAVPAGIESASDRLAEACATRGHPRARRWKYAIAASVLLCLAAGVIYLTLRDESGSRVRSATALMRIDSGTPLYGLLESGPSARVIEVPGEHAAMRAVLTFRAKDGRFCREFEVLAGAAGSTGVACREQGEWRAEVLMSGSAALAGGDRYTPAGHEEDPAISRVVDRLVQGDPLSAQEEAQAMANGWRASDPP